MNIEIRKYKESDAKIIVPLIGNPNVYTRLRDGIPVPYKVEDALGFIRNSKDLPVFAICLDGQAIGTIGLTFQENIHRLNAELGYWLGEQYWGQGIMTEAIKLISDYAFENLEIERIFACVMDINIGSQRALLKAGFELENVIKRGTIKNGELHDEHRYSIYKK